jgi:hypothetical protein
MMSKRLAADRRDNLIRLELGRGCYLLMTWAEYTAGLERGKRERRSLRMAQPAKPRRDERTVERGGNGIDEEEAAG